MPWQRLSAFGLLGWIWRNKTVNYLQSIEQNSLIPSLQMLALFLIKWGNYAAKSCRDFHAKSLYTWIGLALAGGSESREILLARRPSLPRMAELASKGKKRGGRRAILDDRNRRFDMFGHSERHFRISSPRFKCYNGRQVRYVTLRPRAQLFDSLIIQLDLTDFLKITAKVG